MLPELFRVGSFSLNSYGVLLALAFVCGLWLTLRFAARRGLNRDRMIDLSILIMISAIIGSRLLYVLFHLDEFEGRWTYIFFPVQPDGTLGLSGLIFLGGVMGAVIASLLYVNWKKIPPWRVADSIAPALAFGIFLGRIGCFLNGCCFGKSCEMPWGVRFPQGSAANHLMQGAALHPSQIYEATYGILIFLTLLLIERTKPFDGQLTGVFLVLYGLSRFTVDFFRYYESQMFLIAGLDFNQIVSLVMLVGGIFVLFTKRPNRQTELMQ